MRRIASAVVVVLVASVCSSVSAETPLIAWRTDIDAAWRSTKENERLLLLYVKSENCYFCRKMESDSYRDPQVKAVIEASFVPAAIHAGKSPELTKKMGISAFPTSVIINSDGQVIDAVEGYVPAKKLQDWLKAASARRTTARRK